MLVLYQGGIQGIHERVTAFSCLFAIVISPIKIVITGGESFFLLWIGVVHFNPRNCPVLKRENDYHNISRSQHEEKAIIR